MSIWLRILAPFMTGTAIGYAIATKKNQTELPALTDHKIETQMKTDEPQTPTEITDEPDEPDEKN